MGKSVVTEIGVISMPDIIEAELHKQINSLHRMVDLLRDTKDEVTKQIIEINKLSEEEQIEALKKELDNYKTKIKNLDKLHEYSNLEYDWNGNKAEPFTKNLINLAWEKLSWLEIQPEVFPTACGSVQFEYEKENGDYLEFEIYEDRIELFDIIDGEESELIFLVSVNLNKIVNDFHVDKSIYYFNRGVSYHNRNQYDKAIADYSRVIELDSNDAGAYNNRGASYSDLQQNDKAIADYTKAIELDPNYSDAYYNRGNNYNNLKEYDKAIEDYKRAIEINPNDAEVYFNRGMSYNDINQYEKAIADYTKAIELDPNYAMAYNNRGVSYDRLNQYDKAISDYTKAIELDPDKELYKNNLEIVKREAGIS